MEHYLEDQYQIAKAATVTVAPTGEVILVCAENHDTLLDNIEKALGALDPYKFTALRRECGFFLPAVVLYCSGNRAVLQE